MSKIFILGLPRTGTTSLCALLLQQGYKTAHTAYTIRTFELADVIADTPVFCDYPYLDSIYPNAKFIYLDRDMDVWLPSIVNFLHKAIDKLNTSARGFNPVLSRAYRTVFALNEADQSNITERHLAMCYQRHREQVLLYFKDRPIDLLRLDVSRENACQKLAEFLGWQITHETLNMPCLNVNGQIVAWDKIKHPLKISSNAFGQQRRKYFDIPRSLIHLD